MVTIDIVFLAIVGLSLFFGLLRGLVKEALSLTTWIVAIVLSSLLGPVLAQQMAGLIGNVSLRTVAAFAILFVATIFIGTLISNLVAKLTRAAGLGGADRSLGAIFGFLRGLIIAALIVLLARPFEFAQAWFQGSLLVPYIALLIEQVSDWLFAGPVQ